MIIKGGSRGGPTQLAWHLQRRDTNEKIRILELQSPIADLKEAFRDWQVLSEGTKGFKGLYHANIDPAKGYTMTPEQWQRSVEVLEEELGFKGQPRAVVMHEKHGRTHMHVVWARTDIDTMTLRSDSQNYMAHERASQRLELEFGHEMVPGKHAKRDREKQPEFPEAVANQAEWQQGERTGIDPAERKEQITALKQSCDNGQAFKTALEEQGYMLAKGDRRDFVIVDETGSIHSLGRQIKGLKAAELRAFMKDVDREALPSADEAVELQRHRQKQAYPEKVHQEERGHQEEAKQEPIREQKPQPEEPKKASEKPAETSTPPEPTPDPAETERAAAKQAQRETERETLKKATLERQAQERSKTLDAHKAELDALRQTLDHDNREKVQRFEAMQQKAMDALLREQKQATRGFTGFLKSVRNFFSRKRAHEREMERQAEREDPKERQKNERAGFDARLAREDEVETNDLKERQQAYQQEQVAKAKQELERYMRELDDAHALQDEYEEQEKQREKELQMEDDGLERPPPKMTK